MILQICNFQCCVSVVTKKNDLAFQVQCNKKRTVLIGEVIKNKVVHTAVHTAPFVDVNRDVDVRSCPGTAVHASGTSQSLPSPFVPASENGGHYRKNTKVESRQTQEKQTVNATRNLSFQKSKDFTVTVDLPQSNCLLCSVV